MCSFFSLSFFHKKMNRYLRKRRGVNLLLLRHCICISPAHSLSFEFRLIQTSRIRRNPPATIMQYRPNSHSFRGRSVWSRSARLKFMRFRLSIAASSSSTNLFFSRGACARRPYRNRRDRQASRFAFKIFMK